MERNQNFHFFLSRKRNQLCYYENRYSEDFKLEYDTYEFVRKSKFLLLFSQNQQQKKTGNNDRLQSKTTELSQFSTRKLVFESFPAGLNLDMTSDPSGRALCNLFNSIRHGHIYSQRKVEILCSLKSTKKENNNVRLL